MAASDIHSDIAVDDAAALGTPPEPEEEVGATMTLVEHLEEFRRRVLISLAAVVAGSIVGFVFWERILAFLLTPLPSIKNQLTGLNASGKLIQTDLGGPLMVAIQISLAAGIALASPMILYQLWGFITPALTRKERRYALPFTLLGVALFVAGVSIGFFVLRYPVEWLIGFGHSEFTLLLKADSYLTFVAFFLLAFGIVFELPLVLTFMGVVGIVSSAVLREKRRYILFGLWVASCFITPGADPYSPVIIAVCLTILFELSIVLLRILHK